MKAAAVTKIGNLRDPDESKRGVIDLIDYPEQELGPEDVKIRVAYCAICGSDPHTADGTFGTNVPLGLGHELSGVVEALGEKASRKGLKVGDHIACDFRYTCGTCYYCQNGQPQFCMTPNQYRRPGMAEYVIWHESQCYKLPDGVSLLNGCLMEPVSIAIHMVDQLSPKLGARIAVSGGGPIGQLVLQCLRYYGATSLTMIEPIANRRELAMRFGAKYTIDPVNQDVVSEAMKITNGLGFDAIVDVSGIPAAVEKLPLMAARGGKLLFGAMYPVGYNMPFDLYNNCYRNELTVVGSFLAPFAFPRTVQMLPQLDLSPFTEKVFPLSQVKEAFAAHISGKYPKIVVKCNDVD